MPDHSNCALLFAETLGLKFATPEMFFENAEQDYNPTCLQVARGDFVLSQDDFTAQYLTKCGQILLAVSGGNVLRNISNRGFSPSNRGHGRKVSTHKLDGRGAGKTIILVNGPPSSGKSHFINKFMQNHSLYSWVN